MQQTKGKPVLSIVIGCLMVLLGGVSGMWALEDISSIAHKAPAVHFSGALLGGFALVPLGLGIVMGATLLLVNRPARARQFRDKVGDRLFFISIGLFLLVLVIQPFATRLILPIHGYSICHQLKDSHARYGNDWVQDLAWCLPDKTMQEVNALAAVGAGANIGVGQVPDAVGDPASDGE